jgi:hypothetical protein
MIDEAILVPPSLAGILLQFEVELASFNLKFFEVDRRSGFVRFLPSSVG